MDRISKTDFKAHALEVLRDIERHGQPRIITDRGRPTLEIRRLRMKEKPVLEVLKGSVLKFEEPTDPVSQEDWDNA